MSCIVNPSLVSPFIDKKVVQGLQTVMASTGWVEQVFGLAEKSMRKQGEEDIIYPAILKQDCNDYIDLFPNDRLPSFCFFERRDEIDFDYNEDELTYTIGIICWADLSKVSPSLDHDYTDQLIVASLNALQKAQIDDVEINPFISVVTDRTLVWDRYDRTFQDYKYHAYPFTTFRLDIELTDYSPILCQDNNISFGLSQS